MRIGFAVVLIAVAALAGCGGPDRPAPTPTNANSAPPLDPPKAIKPESSLDPNFKPCNPYFPLVPGSQAKYAMIYSSGLQADETVVVDKIEEGGQTLFRETAQIVDRSGGMQINQTTVRRFACDGDKVRILSEETTGTVGGTTTSTSMKYRDNSLIVPERASLDRKGFTWSYALHPTFTRQGEAPTVPDQPTIVNVEAMGQTDVTVPAGKFKALQIQRKVNQFTSWDYLVPGLGLIKREAAEGTRLELKEYSGLKPAQ